MVAKKPPETWFWSYDIEPDQIDSLMTPGMRLLRLSSYGSGKARRFAALLFKEAGPDSSYALDLGADALLAKVAESAAHPVSITVDVDGSQPRFSLVLQKGPGSLTTLHTDLDEAALHKLLDDQHCIADLATYLVDGVRKYAAILEERSGPSWIWSNVSAHELDAKLVEMGATLVRLRSYLEAGQRRFVAVAERLTVGRWSWYADIDGDEVAKNLESNDSYPFDLDASRDERGALRFSVVMYRERS